MSASIASLPSDYQARRILADRLERLAVPFQERAKQGRERGGKRGLLQQAVNGYIESRFHRAASNILFKYDADAKNTLEDLENNLRRASAVAFVIPLGRTQAAVPMLMTCAENVRAIRAQLEPVSAPARNGQRPDLALVR